MILLDSPKWFALVSAILMVMLLSASCGRNRLEPTPEPNQSLPTSEPSAPEGDILSPEGDTPADSPAVVEQSTTVENASIDSIIDVNLLTKSVRKSCDNSANATMECSEENGMVTLKLETPESDYARWQLAWERPSVPSLTGTETLHIRLKSDGDLKPNLYLVDSSDQRISTKVRVSKSAVGWQDIYLPLAEIQDEDGNRPNFPEVTEAQLVFEWADMAGTLLIERFSFQSVWSTAIEITDETHALADSLTVPDGFVIEPLANDLNGITQIAFVNQNEALVSLQNGRVWRLQDTDDDQIFDQRSLYFTGLTEIVGLLYDTEDGSVWVGGRGQLYRTMDSDGNGVADQAELRVDGLPWGRHQNNGLTWSPDPDPFTGEMGNQWIYFGLGSTGDLEIGGDISATVLRFPKDGQGQGDLEVVSAGNRNAYDVVWGQVAEDEGNWHLFASENGPDFNDAPDEVNHIRWQHHYGFPEHFGVSFDEPATEIDEMPYSGSLYDVTAHASASGLAYVDNPAWPAEYRGLYVSLFGQVFSEAIVGHTVDYIQLTPEATETGLTFRGQPTTFIEGLERPLPMTVDPAGNLIVGDYAMGVIYRVIYNP